MNAPRTVLIDGDMIIFKAGFANEKTEKGILVSVNPPHQAYKTCKDMIKNILLETGCGDYMLFITDKHKTNFRYKVAVTQPYKENRKSQKRPELEKEIRHYLIRHWGAVRVKGIEVDDALGIYQDKENGSTIIASNDKDLDMIPGWHFDIDVGKERTIPTCTYTLKSYKRNKIYYVTDPGFLSLREVKDKKILCGAGALWFCAQLLMGDRVDNIPGLKKVGPVSAYEILKDCDTYCKAVKVVYSKYIDSLKSELDSDQILSRFKEVAQLLWIKRAAKEKIFPLEWVL
jgi:5'-3' exonuclease